MCNGFEPPCKDINDHLPHLTNLNTRVACILCWF